MLQGCSGKATRECSGNAPGKVTAAILEAPAMAAEREEEEAAMVELAALLGPEAGAAAREGAAAAALALSGSAAGRRLLAGRPEALEALLELATGPAQAQAPLQAPAQAPAAARDALSCLVNVSAEPAARGPLLAALPALLGLLPAGPACGLLANLCRERGGARRVLRGLRELGPGLTPLLRILSEPQPPAQLGPLLCNLSQLPEGRRGLLDRSRCSVQRLLPFTQCKDSVVQRRGVVGALRNCCFEYEDHEWLLSEEVDILPFLLLPLAGPEELPEDETERLPPELQYLPQDKQREEDPDIRKMLLEAIMLLTATPGGRRAVRAQGAYVVLRELHAWEREPAARAACEKLIQVLIGDEPPAGLENLLEVTVPEELERELRRLDREEEERWRRERGCDAEPPRAGAVRGPSASALGPFPSPLWGGGGNFLPRWGEFSSSLVEGGIWGCWGGERGVPPAIVWLCGTGLGGRGSLNKSFPTQNGRGPRGGRFGGWGGRAGLHLHNREMRGGRGGDAAPFR
ncbi:protein HGH1 homolog [Opisthocomus hoazin]|uniref:protein HGH1 homolog n=1 Tax=Opisthocomus hoazin TaxID=30419 RepID=UPI003F52C11A